MNIRRILLVVASLATLAVGSVSAETVYRWTDADGNITFSKKPPNNAAYQTISTSRVNSSGSFSSAAKKPAGTHDKKKGYEEKLSQVDAERKTACEQARKNKDILLTRHQVTMQQKDGSRKVLSYEEKLKEIAAADKNIADFCD